MQSQHLAYQDLLQPKHQVRHLMRMRYEVAKLQVMLHLGWLYQ